MIETLILAASGIFAGSAFLTLNARLKRVEETVRTNNPVRFIGLDAVETSIMDRARMLVAEHEARTGRKSVGLEEAAKIVTSADLTMTVDPIPYIKSPDGHYYVGNNPHPHALIGGELVQIDQKGGAE